MNYWSEAGGGLRGSTLLAIGTVTMIIGAIFSALTVLGPIADSPLAETFRAVSRLVWLASLFIQGTGFIWTAINPIMSRWGMATGLIFIVQGLFVGAALFMGIGWPVPPGVISIARLMLLIVFVIVEARNLSQVAVATMIVAPLLIVVKIVARITGLVPELEAGTGIYLDSGLLTLLGIAMLIMSKSVRNAEESWAKLMYREKTVGLEELNNPQHPWNK